MTEARKTFWPFDRLTAKLAARANATGGGNWTVLLNGIELGTLPDAEYAAMRLAVFQDWNVAGAQLLNVGRVALTVLERAAVACPLLLFWMVIGAAVSTPDDFNEMQFTAENIVEMLRVVWLIMGFYFVIAAGCGHRFGFQNRYSGALNRLLRERFNTPVDGEFKLLKFTSSLWNR